MDPPGVGPTFVAARILRQEVWLADCGEMMASGKMTACTAPGVCRLGGLTYSLMLSVFSNFFASDGDFDVVTSDSSGKSQSPGGFTAASSVEQSFGTSLDEL